MPISQITGTDKLAAVIDTLRDRTTAVITTASPSPDLMRGNEGAYAALGNLLAVHAMLPDYAIAAYCEHPAPPQGAPSREAWEEAHPVREGWGQVEDIRVCIAHQDGFYCPDCTREHFERCDCGEVESVASCTVRSAIFRALPAVWQERAR